MDGPSFSEESSITYWIHHLKQGSDRAPQELYQRYVDRLVRLARKKLAGTRRREADEEDIAQHALASFFAGVGKGRFPELHDREDLWQVLFVLVDRKATDQKRRQFSQKRRPEVGESAIGAGNDGDSSVPGIAQRQGREPTPEDAEELIDALRGRLLRLDDPHLRQVALWKMEGWTNTEIAEKTGFSTRWVERRLSEIRRRWTHDDDTAL